MCCKDKKVIDYVEHRTNTVNMKDFKDGDIIKLKNDKIEKILHIRHYPTAPYPYEVTFESNKWKSETYLCNGGISLVSESPMDIIGKEEQLLLNASPIHSLELVTVNQIKPLQLLKTLDRNKMEIRSKQNDYNN